MRNSRDRWVFFQHESKPILTSAEVAYWKNTLKRILKVGKEFEFNLPDQTGTCHGDSVSCPCKEMAKSNCWKECLHAKACETSPDMSRCANRSEKCRVDKCIDCEDYKFKCAGIFCQTFETKCFDCEEFETSCKNCPDRFDPEKNPEEIRKRMKEELNPSHCYGLVTGAGVHSITRDGSLLGDEGAEIVTVGRRVDYWEFYSEAKRIIDSAMSRGAYMNERCSTHMHLLASYYGKVVDPKKEEMQIAGVPTNISELEREMPGIILANFHQLCRRYQNAMTWMTMALDNPDHMTRWEKFRVSVLEYSAVLNDMNHVKELIRSNCSKSKYGWVNYEMTKLTPKGDVRRFHVEMRVADGFLAPSAVAAIACMYYALAIKAVEISKYGVLEVGDDEWMSRARKVKETLLNGNGGYDGSRFGNTSKLTRHYDTLRTESLDLIRQLKHILIKVGPAYHVLEKLAERPIALRRCDGQTWQEIESDLEIPMSEETRFETKVSEYIDLRIVDECQTIEEWVNAVGQVMKDDPDFDEEKEGLEERITNYIEHKRNEGELVWSESLGSVVLI
jgi:hypothetical protein